MFVKEWWHERPKHHVSRVSGGQILGQQKSSESSDTPKGQGPRAIEDIIFFTWHWQLCGNSFNQQNLEDSLGSKEPSPEFHST